MQGQRGPSEPLFTRAPDVRESERGTALIFSIILTVSVSALVMAHLGEVNSEKRKISSVMARQRATERAIGSLERARNVINAAPYVHGKNTAIWAAIHSDPPYVPGTDVRVERVGPTDCEWFMLRALGNYQQFTQLAQVFVRQRSPLTGFNLFVQDHPVGVSGQPEGEIHTNKKLEFMFPFGTYTDSVSASQGYEFVADATPENTRIWGPSNPAAAPMNNVLSAVKFDELRHQAQTLRVTDDLLAEVEFQNKKTKIDLYTPETRTLVPRVGTRRVFDGWDTVTRQRKVMEFLDVPYRIKVPTYADVTEHVTQKIPKYSWHTRTLARKEPVYQDQVEHYYENEDVWGTKFVARTTYETDFVNDGAAKSAVELLKQVIDDIERLEGLSGTNEAGVAVADPDAKGKGKKKSVVDVDLKKERGDLDKALRHMSESPPDYDKAKKDAEKVPDKRHQNKWIDELAPDGQTMINNWYAAVQDAITAIDTEKANGGSTKTDYGDLSNIDVAKLAEIQAHGSRSGNTAAVELRAIHDYIEIPYVVQRKLVRKTRLKRVKTSERLVTFVEKIRRFSHNETKHLLRKRRVYKGEAWASRTRRVAKGWKVISEDVQVPRYRTETYTYLEEVITPRMLARTEVVDTTGLIYIEKEIEKMSGPINGQLTLASNTSMRLTDSIYYVDDAGRRRMLGGEDPAEAFQVNPDYMGSSVLLLISREDITYSKDLPQRFELNGSLVSVFGKVAMDGIDVSADGSEISVSPDVTANPAEYVKESMRRLGGILAAKRPVAAYVDKDNNVVAGFRQGSSLMDSNMLSSAGGATLPPSTPQYDRPIWTLHTLGKKIDLMQ